MVVHLAWYWAIALDAAAWAGWGLATGYAAHRLAPARVDHDTWFTRPRRWEHDGRTYRRLLRVHRWQRRLPEAGAVFTGGTDKRRVGGRSTATLGSYAAETRRAELAHWWGVAVTPLFALWNPPGLFAAMVAYAVVANVPCIASLRHNRLRLGRVLARRARRGDG